MIGSIPTDSPEQKARVEKLKQMTPAKIAPMVVFLASDLAVDISGQVFAVRNHEIFLMSQSRPLRSVHRSEGWTPEAIAEQARSCAATSSCLLIRPPPKRRQAPAPARRRRYDFRPPKESKGRRRALVRQWSRSQWVSAEKC